MHNMEFLSSYQITRTGTQPGLTAPTFIYVYVCVYLGLIRNLARFKTGRPVSKTAGLL